MKNKKSSISRRQFIGSSLAASVGVAAGGSATAAAPEASIRREGTPQKPFNPRTFDAMPTRAFGNTGYKVGVLSLGGQATLERAGMEKEAVPIIHRAIDLGINYIDTAYVYGRGVSEKNIGEVMKDRRNEVFLACKTPDRTYDGSMRILDEELARLHTDHVNIWQLHNVRTMDELDAIFADDGAIHAMEEARDDGRVGYIGITGHFEPLVLKEALNRYDFDSILMAVNAADVHYLSFKNYLLPEAQRKGVGIISMKVATRGRMLSCWTPPPAEEQPERLRTPKPGTVTIKEALTYNMSLPVSTTIIGVDNIAQIEENVKIASEFSPLSDAQMEEIEFKTLPIVRQGLYFRRWEMGA